MPQPEEADDLRSVLSRIASDFDLNAAALHGFAQEDQYGGWDHGASDFPKGSIWRVDGQVLYALVRALRPSTAVEFGTHYGASATHLTAALKANGKGMLISVDIGFREMLMAAAKELIAAQVGNRIVVETSDPWVTQYAADQGWDVIKERQLSPHSGSFYYSCSIVCYQGNNRVLRLPGSVPLPFPACLVPKDIRKKMKFIAADAHQWIEHEMGSVDFVFEDLIHTRASVYQIARIAAEKLTPGGMLVSHDALHPSVGEQVRAGFVDAGLKGVGFYLVEPSDCGLAIWRRPVIGEALLSK